MNLSLAAENYYTHLNLKGKNPMMSDRMAIIAMAKTFVVTKSSIVVTLWSTKVA